MEATHLKKLIVPEVTHTNSNHRKAKPGKINARQVLGIIISVLHYTCAGMLSGFSSVLLAQVKDNSAFQVTNSEASWISSIVVLPMPAASLLAGILASRMPRKTLLILIAVIEAVGWFTIYMGSSVHLILIGRILTGAASASGSPLVPTFLGEISQPPSRGVYLSMVLLGLSLGVLVIHVLGAIFSWQNCVLFTLFILLIYICLVMYLKETYVWYIRRNNRAQAETAFFWYRGRDEESVCEFEKLITRQQEDHDSRSYSFREMVPIWCSKLLLMPVCITSVGMATMHLSGAKAIMFHSISIVSKVIPTLNEYTSTILVDFIRIVVTLLACFVLKRFPVRKLFIFSGVGSALSHFSFAAFNYYSMPDGGNLFPSLALLSLLAYTVFSSLGISPLCWVIAGEIFPLIVKGIASGICCFVYFLLFFIVVKISQDLFEMFGISGGFLVFGVCTLIGTCIMFFILPETKDKTLKEIEDFFR